MSRRKQPNPAKLGDAEVTKTPELSGNSSIKNHATKPVDLFLNYINNGTHNPREVELDIPYDKGREAHHDGNGNTLEDHEDSLGSIGTDHGSWGSIEQASPAPSSCPTPSSSLSDAVDGEIAFTVGVTETTPYACKICNKAFARSSLLSKHEQSHTDQLQYGCSYCPRLFKHKRSRDRHIKLHTGDKKYKCIHCQTAFSRSDHLKIHLKTHDNSKPFRCLVCTRGYNTAAALTSHQQTHSKQSGDISPNSENLKCLHCSGMFNRLDLLQVHISSKHSDIVINSHPVSISIDENATWACIYCNKDFASRYDMQDHINIDHSLLLNGNFKSNSPENLSFERVTAANDKTDSSNRVSNNSPTYACDSCSMQFNSVEKLKIHDNCMHWNPPQPLKPNPTSFMQNYNSFLLPVQNIVQDRVEDSTNMFPVQSQPTDLSRKRRAENNSDFFGRRRVIRVPLAHSNVRKMPRNEEWPSFICNVCGIHLPNFASFKLHMEVHVTAHGNGAKAIFKAFCPICKQDCRDLNDLGNHIIGHKVNYDRALCCRICKRMFDDNINELQRFIVETHACTAYKCCICPAFFETKIDLIVHFTNQHISECQHFKCQYCTDIPPQQINTEMHGPPGAFNTSRVYVPAFCTSGQMERLLPCSYCRNYFRGQTNLQLHMLREHNTEPHGSRMPEDVLHDQPSTSRIQRNVQPNSSVAYPNTMSSAETIARLENALPSNLICDVCGSADFNNETEVAAHKKLHHTKSKVGPVSLQCAYCNEHCKSRSDLESHMKSHQINSSKGKHKCNICDEIYTSGTTLAEHKLSHCKIVSGNTCTQCKTTLTDEQSFYSHQVQHSTVMNKQSSQISLPANCIVCCQTLQTDVEIKLHANFHLQHLIQKEFLCSVCGRIFENRTRIAILGYERNSENVQVSICKECINKCGNNFPLSNIRPSTSNENLEKAVYSCLKCTLTFENENEAQQHIAEHGANDTNNYECYLCRSILPTPLKLQLHVIEHSFFGTGQFQCYICSSVFTTANGLLSHMLEHGENTKPYECTGCQMKFFFQSELDNHKYEHILAQAVTQSVTENNQREEGENNELSTKCPYCDLITTYEYFNVHVETCFQNPKFKKKQEGKRKHKSVEKFSDLNESEK